MPTFIELEVDADRLALGGTFDRIPALRVEIERAAGGPPDRPLAHAWLTGADHSEIAAALERDGSIGDARLLEQHEDGGLFRLEYGEAFREFFRHLFDHDGVVLSAVAEGGTWRIQVRFLDGSDISAVFGAASAEFDATLNRMYEEWTGTGRTRGLSKIQRETLALAHKRGYYDIPRAISQEDLADELSISRQALSERLRRAHAHVIATWLFETAGEVSGSTEAEAEASATTD